MLHKTTCVMCCNGLPNMCHTQVCRMWECMLHVRMSHLVTCEKDLCNPLQCAKWQAGRAKCRRHINDAAHEWRSTSMTQGVLPLHKLLHLSWGTTDFGWGSCILENHSHIPTTDMAPPRINFGPGPAGCSRHFESDLSYMCRVWEYM